MRRPLHSSFAIICWSQAEHLNLNSFDVGIATVPIFDYFNSHGKHRGHDPTRLTRSGLCAKDYRAKGHTSGVTSDAISQVRNASTPPTCR
jgi:hypothetical protein